MRLTFSRTRNPENRVQKQDLLVLPVLRPALPLRLRAFLRDPAAVLGLAIVAAAIIAALAAPVLAPHNPTEVSLGNRILSPSGAFPLGAGHLGRDELSRLLYGGRATLGTASVVLAMVMIIALVVGASSATTAAGWIPSCWAWWTCCWLFQD